MRLSAMTALIALSVPLWAQPAAAQQFVDVREIATDTLHDVALTTLAPGRPRIYYNPSLMQQVGPNLAAFVMAHEFGHVRYGHTGSLQRSRTTGPVSASRRQRQELEADCYASRILGDTDVDAIQAAIRFFAAMGPFRFDSLHPSGAQRAAMIQSCLPGRGAGWPAEPVGAP
jgi:hypothetical protein